MKNNGPTPILQAAPTTLGSPGRALVIIDVENLAGTGRLTPSVAEDIARAMAGPAPGVPPHLRIVGCDAGNALDVGMAFPGDRLVTGRGPDGADLALIAAVDIAHTANRFDRVVIASGDGAFTPVAAECARRGLEVVVMTGHGGLSRTLRLASHSHVSILRDLPDHGEAA